MNRAADSSRCACALFDSYKLVAGIHNSTVSADRNFFGCHIVGYFGEGRKYLAFHAARSVASHSRGRLANSVVVCLLGFLGTCTTFVDPPASVGRCKVAAEQLLAAVWIPEVWPVRYCLQQLTECFYVSRKW